MADTSPPRGRWAFRPVPPEPRSIVELVRAGTLDAELAATLWLLVEARVPAGGRRRSAGRGQDHAARTPCSTSSRPASTPSSWPAPTETFDWLPQAPELGWPGGVAAAATGCRSRGDRPPSGRPAHPPDTTVLLVPELSDHLPTYTWGAEARIAIRAASIGYGLAATIHADSLDEVFDALRQPPVRLADDELSRLGRRPRPAGRRRRPTTGRGRPLRPAGRPRRPRSRPASRAGGARHLGPGATIVRALRLGHHPRARRPDRPARRRLRARGRAPPRLPRRPGHGRRRPASRTSAAPSMATDTPPRPAHPPWRPRRTRGQTCRPPRAPATIAELDASGLALADGQGRASSQPAGTPRGRRCRPARDRRLRGLRGAGHRERDPRGPGPGVPGRARPGEDAHGPRPGRPARRVAPDRPRRRAQRRPDRARQPGGARDRRARRRCDGHRLAAARPPLRREAGDARHHDRRPHRRSGPDQGRRRAATSRTN